MLVLLMLVVKLRRSPLLFMIFLATRANAKNLLRQGDRPTLEVSLSSTSNLGSERNTVNHLEGIPYYGSRGDITGLEVSNRLTSHQRSNSNSFMMLSRDKFPQGPSDSQDSPLLTNVAPLFREGRLTPRE